MCRVKIRIDEKLKYAEEIGTHNHSMNLPMASILISDKPEHSTMTTTKAKPKSLVTTSSTDNDLLFNKDVTSDVELITNDREVTLMFLHGYKFTKYFENKTNISYRCVFYTKQTNDCQARIKHNTECGEVLMRSEHNHPIDENSYQAFLKSAVRVRKFTKKPLRPLVEACSNHNSKKRQLSISELDSFHDLEDFAASIGRESDKIIQQIEDTS